MTALLSYKHRNIKGTDYGLSGENMIKIDLITGFLGSGKNNFHKKICFLSAEKRDEHRNPGK